MVAVNMMICPSCAAKSSSSSARFCARCGATLSTNAAPRGTSGAGRWLVLPFILIGRAIAYPIKLWQERQRRLSEACGPDSAINYVPGISHNARRVYRYLADVTLRFGSSHSCVRTIAHVAGLSEHKARDAIGERESRGLLSHRRPRRATPSRPLPAG